MAKFKHLTLSSKQVCRCLPCVCARAQVLGYEVYYFIVIFLKGSLVVFRRIISRAVAVSCQLINEKNVVLPAQKVPRRSAKVTQEANIFLY